MKCSGALAGAIREGLFIGGPPGTREGLFIGGPPGTREGRHYISYQMRRKDDGIMG